MGHYTGVTQAIHRAEKRSGGKLDRIKRQLDRLETVNGL